MNKYILKLIVIFLIVNNYLFGNQWEIISSNKYTFLSKVKFIDTLNGYILGPYNFLITSDGGNSWIDKYNIQIGSKSLVSFDVFKNGVGFLLWSDGTISKTKDYFKSDSTINLPLKEYFNRMFVLDENNIYLLLVTKKTLLLSHDGGKNWIEVKEGFESSKYLMNIFFTSKEIGYACSDQGIIYKSQDGGLTWNDIFKTSVFLQLIFFVNEQTGFVGTSNGTIFMTNDAGENWDEINLPEPFPLSSIYFQNEDYGWAAVVNNTKGEIYSTTNKGKNWILEFSANSSNTQIQNIFFDSNLNGWSVGNSGYILKYLGSSSIKIKNFNLPGNLLFPNPASSTTTIKLTEDLNGKITAVDLLGNETLVWSGFAPAGDLELDVSHLPTGIYTILINSGYKTEALKMIKE